MTTEFVLWVFLAHFIGDFYLQTNWMALNKSKDSRALLAHGLAYSAPLFAGIFFVDGVKPEMGVLWVLTNLFAHVAVDSVTSRITSHLWFVTVKDDGLGNGLEVSFDPVKRHRFFVTIGADQAVHYSIVFLTASILLF